jgi:hypothetical protein
MPVRFLLDHDRQQQYRQRRRSRWPPAVPSDNCSNVLLNTATGSVRVWRPQAGAEDEIVPREDEGQDEADDDAGTRQGKGHVEESPPGAGAVDLRRLLEFAWLRLE